MSFKTAFPAKDNNSSMMKRNNLKTKACDFAIYTLFVLALFTSNFAQSTTERLPTEFESNPAQPYGKLDPNAPAETAQFDFMVGEFECTDKILDQQSGKWGESNPVWNSAYFLNGNGIQDKFWSKYIVASGTRVFDKSKGKWIVNYFQAFPTYVSGVWEGKKEGDKMIMRAPRGENESRLTFHNITENGFDWIGETVSKDGTAKPFWIISCKRRNQFKEQR